MVTVIMIMIMVIIIFTAKEWEQLSLIIVIVDIPLQTSSFSEVQQQCDKVHKVFSLTYILHSPYNPDGMQWKGVGEGGGWRGVTGGGEVQAMLEFQGRGMVPAKRHPFDPGSIGRSFQNNGLNPSAVNINNNNSSFCAQLFCQNRLDVRAGDNWPRQLHFWSLTPYLPSIFSH